ncbi:MAG TPA: hypothetical protein VF212_08265, partial [Longimicrobiales bacterium]
MTHTVIRGTLLAAGLLLGAHAVAHAQTPDSIAAVVNIDDQNGQNLLRLNADGGFVVRGTPGVGAAPTSGEGVRMMWVPALSAFRAGKIENFMWNLDWIGDGSAALGITTLAEEFASFAAGNWAWASAPAATALGVATTASGDTSFAAVMGKARAKGAVAIGAGAEAEGEYALALGQLAKATGPGSIAIGPNTASGSGAVAMMGGSNASGDQSVAIGWFAGTNYKRGAIVLADYCRASLSDTLFATADNQITMRGCGGFRLFTDLAETASVELAPGGSSWLTVSDVNRKENFEVLDGEDVLRRLREVPVMTWNYKSQDP